MTKASSPDKTSTKGAAQPAAVHLLLLALAAIAAYANTFHVPFIFDDLSSITDNPVIKDLSAFLSGGGYAYNPRRFFGYLSFALNYKLGGLDVTGYHAVNLAIHIGNGWLVYSLVRLTLRTPFFEVQRSEPQIQNSKFKIQNFMPLLAALLFVAHPVQTQAVTYIVQRLTSLATLFYLASLVCYVKARLTMSGAGEPSEFKIQNSKLKIQNSPYLFFALSLIAALLAMGTKEIAATLPLALLLFEFSFFGLSGRKKLLFLFLIPILLTLLIIPLGMLQTGKPLGELLSDVSEMARESRLISRGDYLLTQFSVIVTYIRLLFFPVGQNLDYDYPIYHSLFTPRVFFSFLFLCFLLGMAVWLFYRSKFKVQSSKSEIQNSKFKIQNSPSGAKRLMAFGILWFFITLSVESSIIPISDVIFEHRLYLPSVGVFLALAALLALLFRRYSPRALGITVAILVVILASATWRRNLVWGSGLTLWSDTAAKSPNKYRPHNNLGNALSALERTDEAIRELQTALRLKPDYADARNNLGVVYGKKGWLDQSMEQFVAAIRLNPRHAPAHNNLGESYGKKGLTDKAIEEYQAALSLNPYFAEAHNNLGAAYIKKGWTDRAIDELRIALKVKPEDGDTHFNLGAAYEAKGWTDKAINEYRFALKLQPEDREALSRLEAISAKGSGLQEEVARRPAIPDQDEKSAVHYRKANDLTNSGLVDEGIREYEAAIRLKPDFAEAHHNLGVAYGMKGNADKAIEHLQAAIRLKPDDPDSHLNLARAYQMKGLTRKADDESRLADKLLHR